MKKIILPSNWILLGVAGLLDFLTEIRDLFSIISYYYENILGYIPETYKKRNFYQLVWKELKTGNIRRIIKKGKIYFQLTNKGRIKLRREFPVLSFKKKKWDGYFRVVIYDIEEVNKRTRDYLRRKLQELGFGMLQKSVWFSLYDFLKDLQEFLEGKKLSLSAITFETKNFYTGDIKEMAQKVWPITELEKKYEQIYQEIKK